jgi:hypothetical protein
VGAVHDRWELVEPLFAAEPLRSPECFVGAKTTRSARGTLEVLRRERLCEETAIAMALARRNESAAGRFASVGTGTHGSLDEEVAICELLQGLGERCLEPNGNAWSLRVESSEPGSEIARWRAATLLLPLSLITAGALARTGRSAPTAVRVLSAAIAPRQPVAHLHVHLGPMLRFEDLWMELRDVFAIRRSLDGDGLTITTAEELPPIAGVPPRRRPGLRWQWMLELAFLAREVLDTWSIRDRGALPEPGPPLSPALLDFSMGRVDVARRRATLLVSADRYCALGVEVDPRAAARHVAGARAAEERAAARSRRHGGHERSEDRAPEEVRFLADMLARAGAEGPGSDTIARLTCQYLRVKVALYRQLVHDPWIPGLKHFLDAVDRDTPYLKVIGNDRRLDGHRERSGFDEAPLRVQTLEVHAPPRKCLEMSRAPSSGRRRWIISFVRSPNFKSIHTADSDLTHAWRRKAAAIGAEARLFQRAIEHRPRLLRSLRGVSLMSWERNGPVWLFRRSLERLIQTSNRVVAEHPGAGLRPLRSAYHLGEDFDHILTGLRAIFEPFEWGMVARGDRLGHAVALGVGAREWSARNPYVLVRPWDRLLDIGFVCWAADKRLIGESVVPSNTMRGEVRDVLKVLFGASDVQDPLHVARVLWDGLRDLRFDPWRSVDPRALHEALKNGSGDVAALCVSRLTEPGDKAAGGAAMARTTTIETARELPLLEAVQRLVCDRVAPWQTAIEVNPSSNLLIAGFKSLFEEPLFHDDTLPITIHADDPLTFATSLADEYAYAWAGMLRAGTRPADATAQLERAAALSRRYAF